MAYALQAVGAQVTFMVDYKATLLRDMLSGMNEKGFLKLKTNVIGIGKSFDINNISVLIDESTGASKYSHVISIERPSPSVDGRCYTMKARDITDKLDPVHIIFQQGGFPSFPY